MCMTERSDGIFIFLQKNKRPWKKTLPFSASTNVQLRCLIAWSKKSQLVIAYIERRCVRDTGTRNKTKNTWLHLNVVFRVFFLTNTADRKPPHSSHLLLNEGRALMWIILRYVRRVSRCGHSKALLMLRKQTDCVHDICRGGKNRKLVCLWRHSARCDTVASTGSGSHCNIKARGPLAVGSVSPPGIRGFRLSPGSVHRKTKQTAQVAVCKKSRRGFRPIG